jgi:hypothetical protein
MAKEIEAGMTYPQETMPPDAFESYFFSGDVFLAIASYSGGSGGLEGTETNLTIEEARQQRTWEECVAGYYYVGRLPRSKLKIKVFLGETQLPRKIVPCK